jgi:hypothetical protein
MFACPKNSVFRSVLLWRYWMFSFTIEDARYGSDAKRGAAGTEERIS